MAKYTKIASLADAELFQGDQRGADNLVVSYPDIISIAKDESPYTVYSGANNLVPALTGVTGTITTDKAGSETVPAVVTLVVTNKCTTDGNITISVLGAKPVTIAVEDTLDTVDKVATQIRNTVFAGFTLTGATDTVIFTVSEPLDAILNVINEKGEVLNCYATNLIVFNHDMDVSGIATESTEIWNAVNFAKYFTALPS